VKKIIRTAVIILALFSILSAFGCKKDEPVEDGGHSSYSDPDAPKEIKSGEITGLQLEFKSDYYEQLESGTYRMSVKKESGGKLSGTYYFAPFGGYFAENTFTFEPDAAFMKELDAVIKESGIIAYNGKYEKTYGIPDEFGYDITINYASGETVSSADNVNNQIPEESCVKLRDMFFAASGAEKYFGTDKLQNVYYRVSEQYKYYFSANIIEKPDGTVSCTLAIKEDGKQVYNETKTVPASVFDDIDAVYKDNDMEHIEDYPRRGNEVIHMLELRYGTEEKHVTSNSAISDSQLEALKGIEGIIREYMKVDF